MSAQFFLLQRGVVDLDDLAALVAAADDVFMVEIKVRVAEVAEGVDIRVVEDGLERRRVDAPVRRREQAFMEGGERPVDVLQTLVRHDVDAARRGGDVELDAADDSHAVHLSRDEIQIGKMPFMRAVRVGGAVVGDRDGLEAHVMCRLHHFGQRAERMVGDVGMCMKIRNDLHFTSVPPVQSVMLPYNLSVICRVHCLSVRKFVSKISRTPARRRAYNRTCGAGS